MNLEVLASHEGTTLQSLLDAFAGGRLPAGFGGGEQQWRLWRVSQASRSRRSDSSFVIEIRHAS
jgi:hypothetical protein